MSATNRRKNHGTDRTAAPGGRGAGDLTGPDPLRPRDPGPDPVTAAVDPGAGPDLKPILLGPDGRPATQAGRDEEFRQLAQKMVGAQIPDVLLDAFAKLAGNASHVTVNLPRQHGRPSYRALVALYQQFAMQASSRDIPREWDGEVEQEDMPILAARWAYLNVRHGALFSLNAPYAIPTFAEATCHRNAYTTEHVEEHGPVPDPSCTCGFYAVPADQIAKHRPLHWGSGWRSQFSSGSFPVMLSVQLEGVVCIHDAGYRAQYQRVLGIELPAGYSSRVDGIPTEESIRRIAAHFGVTVTVAE